LAVKQVNIRSDPTIGTSGGLLLGGAAGAGYGNTRTAALEGAIAGALAGAVAQQIYETGNGYEYTIAFTDGSTEVIDQKQATEDVVFKPGAAVMVQYGATRNRVLPADNLPTNVAMPKSVKVAGAPKPTRHLGVTTCQKMPSGNGERKTCTEE
jgi:outer membrane lipoprotein SlyB